MNEGLAPFYMWAGGKARLIKSYTRVWPDDRALDYVEPFFGGGAVFCWRRNIRGDFTAHIGDVNTELMGILEQVKTSPDTFTQQASSLAGEMLALKGPKERKTWYYQQRQAYWETPTPSRLYVLMRTGFNGVWQTCIASQGLFGTPAGLLNQTRLSQIVDADAIARWSQALQTAHLHSGSYTGMPLPERPALIYLDPPYRGSFTTYGTGFSDQDQKTLCAWYRAQAEEGHRVVLANRCVDDDKFFENLIGDIADFHYFDVTYTAGRRKRIADGFEAKAAREFIAVSR